LQLCGIVMITMLLSSCSTTEKKEEEINNTYSDKNGSTEIEKDIPKETNVDTEEESVSINDSLAVRIPDVYEREEENVCFEAEVHCAESAKNGNIEIPAIQLQFLNRDRVADAILKDIVIVDESSSEWMTEDGSISTVFLYSGEQQQSLEIQPYRASYDTDYYRSYLYHAFDLERNAEKYATSGQLSFMTPDEALKDVINLLSDMGVELGSEPDDTYYVLDCQTLSEEEYAIDIDGNVDYAAYKSSWTEEDEAYYFCVWQTYGGIRIHCPNIEFIDKYEDFNAPIQAAISRDELLYLSLGRTFLMEADGKVQEMADLDTIADTVIHKFSMIITDASYRIDHMELVYYPEKTRGDAYEMRCAWILRITEELPDGGSSSFQMAVDAVSAEELY
ncbi:MAG: hypothetical protein Q4D32_12610, partial [Eubacteriales bacterium]|nr:hypothetical protein [Eubacteriales bacterium]